MIRILALAALSALAACSEVPNHVNGKLLCLHETGEAYTAHKNIGDTMLIRRQELADPICRELK